MKCTQCGKSFEPQRSTAKFCSNKCKLAFRRNGVSVSEDKVSVSDTSSDATEIRGFVPNWKTNGYHSAKDALLFAVGEVMGKVPNPTIVMGKQVFTNIKEKDIKIKKAQYCKVHNQVRMDNKYLCGCKI